MGERRAARNSRLVRCAGATAVALLASVIVAPSIGGQETTGAQPSILFVQNARSGSLVPVDGNSDEFVLTLRGLGKWAVWFTDRPDRQAGHLPHRKALDALGFDDSPQGPPNAVLSVPGEADDQNMVALTLHDPEYRARKGTVEYRVTLLPEVVGAGLESYAGQSDESVPRRFSGAALFIDSTGISGGCNITIHFRAPGKVIFLNPQDVEPTLDSFKGIPAPGTEFAQGSDLTFSNEVYGFPTDYCQIGMVFRTIEPTYGQGLFIYFNNPLRGASSWGCGTTPPGWRCAFQGNESGQPLRVEVTIS